MRLLKISPQALLLIILGSITWSLTMVKSGLVYSFGMGFWGPNGHDGVWHVALINSLASGFFDMPIFAGEDLRNYHIGFDLLLAFLHRLTNIHAYSLYFQVLPPILAILIGILTYRFVFLWKRSKTQAILATFFVYFGGSFGFLITLFRSWDVGGESLFWSQQAISTLINPPFALSLVLALLGMNFLLRLSRRFRIYDLGFTILFFATVVQIKVYAGVLVLGGLALVAFVNVFRKRFEYLVIFLSVALLSSALFFPFNRNASSLIVWQPFWFLETMMAYSDRFYWPKFYEAMTTYRMGGVWVKAIPAYGIAFLIFVVGNLGTRVLGVWEVVRRVGVGRSVRGFGGVDIFLLSISLGGVVLPMLFLQKGTPWNTIQFFYYSLFVFAIYSGIFIGRLWEVKGGYTKLLGRKLLVVAVVLLTIPSSYSTLKHYLPARPPAMISNLELEALEFLKKQPTGVVLTYPFNRDAARLAEVSPPRPLYLYESTAYVSAFSGHPVFLEDEVNLDITGYNWPARRTVVEEWLNTLDHGEAWSFLRENNISYVYWLKGQRARVGEGQWGGTRIFQNNEAEIYKVTSDR